MQHCVIYISSMLGLVLLTAVAAVSFLYYNLALIHANHLNRQIGSITIFLARALEYCTLVRS